ncbi:VCBS repeat-containing protein [Clostridium botulinum D/C]|uniref:VCBS repeat-containing protein n=1 Tax=Clostridium botulinum TaxID=1491 RepID=UPI001E64CC4E|nr:VCBS repeat-containing protein [Clostridium botulinum D/C]MCD3359927.1 VCBS repeat-containing protein [Clostridium botulinum D/C]MCD3361648.1 VCBS repeat-containing protein [Clostridium botulinum D/C]MCD3365689.1 VCBS repeat-containing protein [Clostridium botulinum D/C]
MKILKLKVFFFKRKHIYYFVFILVLIVFCAFSIISNGKSSYITFNANSNKKTFKADITGDGKDDTLYILTNKDKYHLQVTTEKHNFNLQPNKALETLGSYYSHWPIRVKLLDVSRDKIPEIFVQSSQSNVSLQHIFAYKDNKFKDIFCSYNNILGFIDHSNNKTPKILSGKLYGGEFNFENYIIIDNKLEKYNGNIKDTFMGKDSISTFINIITSLNGSYTPNNENIFHSNIDTNSLDMLPHLAGYANNYVFQDAIFMDTRCDKSGEPTNVQWILNFRGSPIDSNGELKNYTLKVNLCRCKNCIDKYYFKILSIQLIK